MSEESTRVLLAAERAEKRVSMFRRRQGRLVNLGQHELAVQAAVAEFNRATGMSKTDLQEIREERRRMKPDIARDIMGAFSDGQRKP